MRAMRPTRRTNLVEATEGRERRHKTKDNFNWKLEDLGVRLDERILLVMYDIDGSGRQGKAVRCS